jgi:hypothetical protein
MLSREEYRKIKGYSKTEMDRWLQLEQNIMYNTLRKQFDNAYRDELDSSIQNFLFAIAYTLHWNEDVSIDSDKMASFMEDLFVTVDMFRKGEYRPEDYAEALKEDGVIFKPYDYDKIYRENIGPIKDRNTNASKAITDLILSGKTEIDVNELQKVLEVLEGGK